MGSASLVTSVASVVILGLSMIRPKQAAKWFLGALLMSPYIVIGGLRFRMELLLVPTITVILLSRQLRRGFLIPRLAWLLMLSWVWLLGATTFSLITADSGLLLWSTAYAFFRPILMVSVYYNLALSEDDQERLLRMFVYAAIPLGVLSVAQVVGNALACSITVNGYSSFVRTPVMHMLESSGRIVRGVSVFESPVYAAVYFLLAMGAGILLLIRGKALSSSTRGWLVLSTACAALGGLVAVSATFLLGCVVLLGWLVFQTRCFAKLHLVGAVVCLLAVLASFLFTFAGYGEQVRGLLEYQKNRIISQKVFQTRYDENTGILSGTINSYRERPVSGWGWVTQPGAFLGDSYYLTMLYYGGWIGLALSLLPLLHVARICHGTGVPGELMALWLILLLATGVGSPSLAIPRVQDWWWAMSGALAWRYAHHGALVKS